MTPAAEATRVLIERLVAATGCPDPVSAIRFKAMEVIESFVAVFGEPGEMPLDLLALASFLGIRMSEFTPAYSPDAELAPDGAGGVEMRLNPDRPETRQRFSVGHEITHTFFPDHSSHVWPRANARYRNLEDPNDYLEMLCDVGASELVFPRRWFVPDAAQVVSAADLLALSARYKASPEATVRRFSELRAEPVVAVFFAWRLKPTQKGVVGRPDQLNLFGLSPADEIRGALRLRVQYSIPSPAFAASGLYIPRDKSVENCGPLYAAGSTCEPADGVCHLELGQARGTYRVQAVPLWTAEEELGPRQERAVAAILRPTNSIKPRKDVVVRGPGLFG
jgi:hypothetical protein